MSLWRWKVMATSSNFKSTLNTLSVVLETCSIYQNVCKHLVYDVFKFHKDCFNGFWRYEGVFITTTFVNTMQYLLFIFWFCKEKLSSLILEPVLSQEQIIWHGYLYNPSRTLFFNVTKNPRFLPQNDKYRASLIEAVVTQISLLKAVLQIHYFHWTFMTMKLKPDIH